jgi:hypothetical protein
MVYSVRGLCATYGTALNTGQLDRRLITLAVAFPVGFAFSSHDKVDYSVENPWLKFRRSTARDSPLFKHPRRSEQRSRIDSSY